MKFRLFDPLRIEVDKHQKSLKVAYRRKSRRAYYDICDLEGKIIRTGQLTENEEELDLSGLNEQEYVLLILDGSHILRKVFRWGITQSA